jgi:hypothetical protein
MNYHNNHLQKRTIQPSEDAWNTLEKRLSDFEKTKKQNKWTFLRYAAAIIIFVAVGVYFFGNKEKQIEIVEQPVLKVKEHKIQPKIQENQNVIATLEEEIPNKIVQKSKVKNAINIQQSNQIAVSKISNKSEVDDKTLVAEVVVNTQNLEIDTLENQKIKEFVALVENIKKEKGEVTDLEIDQLLVAAQKSLITARKTGQNNKFNSADLLADVEYDLDKDFKNRLFEAIVNTLKEPKNIFVIRDN